jgi:type IV pilus assembly protein PilA
MLGDVRGRCLDMGERGFTLVELLVVILVIAILAVIALPTFLGQADKARDATAKSDVRNAVSQMGSCFRSDEEYIGCPDGEHPLAAGVVATVTPDGSTYSVFTLSRSGARFTIERLPGGYSPSCTRPGTGGCKADSSW